MRIALDVMGGDNAPEASLDGAVAALDLLADDDELVLVGNEDIIVAGLKERGCNDGRIEIVPSNNDISMNEIPVEAVRAKSDSSIVKTARLGGRKAEKRADIVISAGNTGAFVTAAQMEMRRLPGVHRPGIGVLMPTFGGPVVICDVGANPEPKAHHLWQYGLMAETYAKFILGIDAPRVAQMNIGGEAAKGSESVKRARSFFDKTPACDYRGYIEGRQIFDHAADVVVTDGFVGNTILKLAEGMAAGMFRMIMAEMKETMPGEMVEQFGPIIKQIYAKHDYHEAGGAPLLGVNGICVISHGSSQARTITSAIVKSKNMVTSGLNDAIVQRLGETSGVAEA